MYGGTESTLQHLSESNVDHMNTNTNMNTNESYTSKVDSGEWPTNPEVPLDQPFSDSRGIIQNLVLKPINSVAVIETKAGSIRSNHYHKTDWHYIYVLSGRILYFERDVGSTEIPKPVEFSAGSMFFTPPMKEHGVAFIEDTVLITAAKNVRSHESHEEDLVRVDFINSSNISDYLYG